MSFIYEQHWQTGCHTSFSKIISNTLRNAINEGMYTTQFFMGSRQGFTRQVISKEDIQDCKKLLSIYNLNVFTHFPYTANLAGQKECLAWNGNDEQDKKTIKVLKGLQYELDTISKLGNNTGVVIHPGNHIHTKKGLKTIAKSINRLKFNKNSNLLLENTAGQGTSLARTFEEIKTIIDNVDEKKRENVNVCIDTCHIFAYGTYDLSKVSEVDRMFNDFDRVIGLKKFRLLHLNDSMCKRGTKKDRHASIGNGYIWGKSFTSLIYLLDKCTEYNIPIVLETTMLDLITLSQLKVLE